MPKDLQFIAIKIIRIRTYNETKSQKQLKWHFVLNDIQKRELIKRWIII